MFALIDPILVTPKRPVPPITLSAFGVLSMTTSTSTELECTSLSGSIGDEEVECVFGDEIASYENVKTLGGGSGVASIASSKGDLLLRNIESKVDLRSNPIAQLTLDERSVGFTVS